MARRRKAQRDVQRAAVCAAVCAGAQRGATRVERHAALDISLPFEGVTEETPIHLGPQTFGLLTNPRLLDVVEQFIGGEIYSNPIQHTRIKPPERDLPEHLQGSSLLARTDWHQDKGVHLPEGDDTDMLTVWLPLTDATPDNGCLYVIRGSHRD